MLFRSLLLNDDLAEDEVREIMGHLRQFAAAKGGRALEMHGRQGMGSRDWKPYLIEGNAQSYAYLPLDRPLDEIWAKVITYQVRKAVQKAQRCDLTVVEKSDEDTIVRDFYPFRSEEHTSELQSLRHLVCRLLLEKKKRQEYSHSLPGTYDPAVVTPHHDNRG